MLSHHLKVQLAETLLAASVFSDRFWMFKALDFAKRIIAAEPEDYLRTWAIRRDKALSRNMPDATDKRFDPFVWQPQPMKDQTLNWGDFFCPTHRI